MPEAAGRAFCDHLAFPGLTQVGGAHAFYWPMHDWRKPHASMAVFDQLLLCAAAGSAHPLTVALAQYRALRWATARLAERVPAPPRELPDGERAALRERQTFGRVFAGVPDDVRAPFLWTPDLHGRDP